MTSIVLVRHAQSEWNAVGRWQGWADPPLSALGREQARQAVAPLGWVDVIMSSDLRRAFDTAAILASGLGMGEPFVMPSLRERDVGRWTGLTRAEIDRRWPGALSGPMPDPPGGETAARLLERVLATMTELAETYEGQTVLAVSHGGTIGGYVACTCDRGLEVWRNYQPDNCSVSEILFTNGRAELIRFSDTSFLQTDYPLGERRD